MFEVIFLGVGAAIPMRGQTNASYLVRAEGKVILVDCGPAVLQQLNAAGVSPAEITHLYFTHRHGDHALGFPLLMLWLVSNDRPPDRYPTLLANQTTWDTLLTLVRNSFGEVANRTESISRTIFGDADLTTHRLGETLTLSTWPLVHTRFAPNSGVRMECGGKVLAFTGDTSSCPNVLRLAQHADLLVHDSTNSATLSPELAEDAYGHSSARLAARNAAKAGARQLALVHISADYEGRQDALVAEAGEQFPGAVSAPTAGTRLVF